MNRFQINQADSIVHMMTMADNSVDSIVTDPPYGLSKEPDPVEVMRAWCEGRDYKHKGRGFMGAEWDSFVPSPSYWKEALRVLKPGGYGLIFAGSRTQDWMTMSLRFAGFEIVDTIMWVYSQGMPKSLNIGKAIDKKLGAKRTKVVGVKNSTYDGCERDPSKHGNPADQSNIGAWGFNETPHGMLEMAPATSEAEQWEGWGTQLKPCYEPILLVRKPFSGTFASNVMEHGVGGLNIDATRVSAHDAKGGAYKTKRHASGASVNKTGSWKQDVEFHGEMQAGRWTTNFAHDGSKSVLDTFPDAPGQQGDLNPTGRARPSKGRLGDFSAPIGYKMRVEDSKSAARFFYCAKPSSAERHWGMENPGKRFKHGDTMRTVETRNSTDENLGNHHPTLKPITLMKWLVKMITPVGGVTLDLFCGSGTTGMAAIACGMQFIGIEREPQYASISKARCSYAVQRLTGEPSKRSQVVKTEKRRYRKGDQMDLLVVFGHH